ncbi:MAG: hypothetical protein ACE5G1_14355 [bacterium]
MISSSQATAQIFWTAFQAMSKKERDAIVEKFLTEGDFMEDLVDAVILKQRKNEPARPLEHYLVDREKRKA